MPALTPNYNFNLPLVNDPIDADLWGTQLNSNWSSIDALLKSVSDTANAALAATPQPGEMVWSFETSKSGWVLGWGTIGSAASAATNRANADTEDLYTVLWNNLGNTQAPVSGGRGASAAADFAANKTLGLPDLRGRVIAGKDDMGGTSANRLTAAGCGFDGDVLGNSGGSEFLHGHTHTASVTDPGHEHGLTGSAGPASPGTADNVSTNQGGTPVTTTMNATTGISVSNSTTGSGSSQNVQPTITMNGFYKL